ncbi:threonine/homoserine/homoserine lactone efflux protein [Bacillus pakistanensis]|uniref:Threonine/homoserine/homoserine lactone efflux protein n=1 Tax=Rossellomorea pakistanensis TaxID=992288 RepID=A0ABS2NCA3_9BACI|nr:LysE family transporter [Bacillus pakistanensis]MBM7585494.1 threonine/homoserine/homoserine lactone efflux protein [Bacillus pakistanensis]
MEFLFTFIHYIVLGISLAAPIGPMNLEVIKRGLTNGFFQAWFVGLGGLTGDCIILLTIYFGFHSFIQLISVQVLMYIIGIVMLGSLGISSIKSAFSKDPYLFMLEEKKKQGKNAYLTGFIISVANPLSLFFWFGVFGTSLKELMDAYSLLGSLLCSFGIIIGLFLWNINLAFTSHFSKKLMSENFMRCITFLAGICLAGFAVSFVYHLYRLLKKSFLLL